MRGKAREVACRDFTAHINNQHNTFFVFVRGCLYVYCVRGCFYVFFVFCNEKDQLREVFNTFIENQNL